MDATDNPGAWVSIDRFFHPIEAHIAAGRLTSEGVPVNLVGIHHASANWLIAPALGGIRLQVPAAFVDSARSILAAESAIETIESETCPQCGSADSSTATNAWKVSLLALHLFSIPLPWRSDRRLCNECSTVWSERQ